MKWGKKQIAGVVYELSHLDPFFLDVTPKADDAPIYRVRVSFGCHTFTRELLPTDTQDFHFSDGRETRCFCPIRHGHSQHLPNMIRFAANGKVHLTPYGNYFVFQNLDGLGVPYAAFFNATKATRSDAFHVAIKVITAFGKGNLPKRPPRVTFATLVAKTANGEKVTYVKK